MIDEVDDIPTFAKRIKAKYPEYKDVEDGELVERIVRKHPTYANKVKLPSTFKLLQTTSGYANLDDLYEQAGREYNIDPNLLLEQGRQETINFNPDVMYGRRGSPAGAKGSGQFMPGTAKDFKVDVNNPISGIKGQAAYMRKLLDMFDNDEQKALAGYNAGEGAVQKYGKVPPYKETQEYTKIIGGKVAKARSAIKFNNLVAQSSVPEPAETINLQKQAAANPKVKSRTGVLLNKGDTPQPSEWEGFGKHEMPDGRTMMVHAESAAKNLKLKTPEEVDTFIKKNPAAIARMTGIVDDVGTATGDGQPVVTAQVGGKEAASAVVTNPTALHEQGQIYKEQFPEAKIGVTTTDEIAKQRVQSGGQASVPRRTETQVTAPALTNPETEYPVYLESMRLQGQQPMSFEDFVKTRPQRKEGSALTGERDEQGNPLLSSQGRETQAISQGQEDTAEAALIPVPQGYSREQAEKYVKTELARKFGVTPDRFDGMTYLGDYTGAPVQVSYGDLRRFIPEIVDQQISEKKARQRIEQPKVDLSLKGLPIWEKETKSEDELRKQFREDEIAKYDPKTVGFWLTNLLKNPFTRLSEAIDAAKGISPDIDKAVEERIASLPQVAGGREVDKFNEQNAAPFLARKPVELASEFYKGLVVDNFAPMLETAGIGQAAFKRYVLFDKTAQAKDTTLFKIGGAMRETHEKGLPKPQGGLDEQFSRTMGQVAGTLLMTAGGIKVAGMFSPAAATTGLQQTSMIQGAITGVAQQTSEAYRMAMARGATEDQAMLASFLSAPGGLIEGLSDAKVFEKLRRIQAMDLATGGKFSSQFMNRLREIGKSANEVGVTELIEEGLQGIDSEVAAQLAYRKNDRDVRGFLKDIDETIKNALIAYPVGALTGGGATALQIAGQGNLAPEKPVQTPSATTKITEIESVEKPFSVSPKPKTETQQDLSLTSETQAEQVKGAPQEKGFEVVKEGETKGVGVAQLKEQRDIARREAERDTLTKLANPAALEKALPAAEADPQTAIIAFDANNLGKVNKIAGHETGDKAIIELANAIKQAASEFGNERVFRRGGDEFVVLADKDTADKIRQRAEEIYGSKQYGDVEVSLSGTVGNTFAEADSTLQATKAKRKTAPAKPLPRGDASRELPPVETTGEVDATRRKIAPSGVSKIGKSIEAKAIEQGLTEGFPQTAGYDKKHVQDQIDRINKLITEDVESVREMALGLKPIPPAISPVMLLRGMEEVAKAKKDAQLQYELANSPLVSETSYHAQEMRMMQEREQDSATALIQSLRRERVAKMSKWLRGRTVEEAIKEEAEKIAATMKTHKRRAATRESWDTFIASIEC